MIGVPSDSSFPLTNMQHNDILSGSSNCIKFADGDWNYFQKLKKNYQGRYFHHLFIGKLFIFYLLMKFRKEFLESIKWLCYKNKIWLIRAPMVLPQPSVHFRNIQFSWESQNTFTISVLLAITKLNKDNWGKFPRLR